MDVFAGGLLVKLLISLHLLPYMIAHLFINNISTLKSFLGRGVSKIFDIKLPENEKRRYEKVFTIVWVLVAIIGIILMIKEGKGAPIQETRGYLTRIITLWQVASLALIFRNGANLSKNLIYRWHDAQVLKEYTNDDAILRIVGRATRLNLVLEGWFLFGWSITYMIVKSTIKGSILSLKLWLCGLIFGIVFGLFMARNNKGILLRNEILIVLLFAAKETREKVLKLFGKSPTKILGAPVKPPKPSRLPPFP